MVTSRDGTAVPLRWFAAPAARMSLLLMPALGIKARLYDKLAAGLAQHGCSVCVMEYRGHGLSPVRPGRDEQWGLGEILDQDIPAALHWVQQHAANLPRLVGGHSLGGHLATIYSGQEPGRVAGVVHLACAFPYVRDYPGKAARQIRLLCRLMPLMRFYPGYFPGHRLGFGGRESLPLMRDWSHWALRGDFDFGGRQGLAEAVAAFHGPVVSVTLEQDSFASDAAVHRALSPFTRARLTRRQLGAAEQGQYLGHTRWALNPEGVLQALVLWLDEEFGPAGWAQGPVRGGDAGAGTADIS